MALMNRRLSPTCETVFLIPAAEHMQTSARLIREIAALGGPIAGLVPPQVEARLHEKFGRR